MQISFLGHACFLLRDSSYSILIDPFLDQNPQQNSQSINANYILVSHGHNDHSKDTISIAKRCGSTVIAPFELANYLGKYGVKTHPMHIGGGHQFPFGWVRLTPAWHGSSVMEGNKIITLGQPCGFLIRLQDKLIYHAGDTGLFSDMALFGELYGQIDIAMLPIGDNFTMGPEEALYAAKLIKPKLVIPMHYNTFKAIKQDPDQFSVSLAKSGIGSRVLEVNDTLEV